MALFSKDCPQCGHKNSPQAGFCAQCGTGLGGGMIQCGACNTQNRSDARFCKECGRPLAASAAAEMRGQSWSRREGDFAVRIEADDLPGLFRRGIVIEPGTNAMLIEGGTNRGLLGPGTYNLDSLEKRFLDWLTVGVHKVSVLLVDVMPAELEFHMGGVFTSDPISLGMSVRLQAQVDEPARFLVQMLSTRERFTREDLRLYLYPEVAQVVEKWVGKHTVQELAEDLGLKDKLELGLEEALKSSFAQTGLKFLNVRTLELNMEHLDRIKGIRSRYALQVTEAEANAQGRKRLVEVMKDLNLSTLAEETAKVEDEERRAELYQRMRQAVTGGKMDEVRSETEFEVFLDDQDRQKLLREKERAELLRTWKEEGEDHVSGRAHLLAKLDLDRQYEIRASELKLRTDLSEKELEAELRMERMRASKQFEIDAARWEYELKRRQAETDFERREADAQLHQDELQQKSKLAAASSEHDEEMRQLDKELELGLKGLRGIKQVRLEAERGQWDLEQQKKEFEWQQQQKTLEVEMQRERIRMEHELNRMDKLGQLGTEALIAASAADQGKILADLKKTEALKGMSEEQILAAAAKDSPDVAHALAEKFRAIAEGNSSQREQAMYEKLLAEKEAHERATAEAWRESNQAVRGMADKALETMRDTATAFARGQSGTPVVITSPSGGVIRSVEMNASESGGETKSCPKCGRFVAADARHCEHCGNKFEGIG